MIIMTLPQTYTWICISKYTTKAQYAIAQFTPLVSIEATRAMYLEVISCFETGLVGWLVGLEL